MKTRFYRPRLARVLASASVAVTLLFGSARAAVPAAAAEAAADREQQLVQVLMSGASAREKDAACRKLKVIGTARCVPAVASLLKDEQLSHSARYVLESMPLREAGSALIAALNSTSGQTQAGIICSLGARGELAAVPTLARLAEQADQEIAVAAAHALGRIPSRDAIGSLRRLTSTPAGPLHDAAVDGLLRQGSRLISARRSAQALPLFEEIYRSEEADGIRLAAYKGMIRASGNEGLKLVTTAILGPADPAQLASLQMAREIQARGATETLTGILPRAQVPAQIALVEALAQRGDPAAAPALLRHLSNADPEVRLPVLKALGQIGDASSVAVLAQFAASGTPAEQSAARQALVALRRGRVTESILRQVASSRPGVQGELARALGERGDQSAVPRLLDLAQKGPDSARNPAIAALGRLVDESQLPGLIGLVLQASSPATRSRAAEAVNQACQRLALKRGSIDAKPLVQAVVQGPKEARVVLLPVCSGLIDPQVRLAIRAGIQDRDPEVAAAAVRALCDTIDPDLIEDVTGLARHTQDEKYRGLAVAGGVRLLTQEETVKISTAQRVASLRILLGAARRLEEKRLVLAGLGEMPELGALHALEPLLADNNLQTEAARAAVKIALTLPGPQAREAMAILRNAAPSVADEPARQSIEAVLKQMEQSADYITDWRVAGPFRQDGKDYAALFDTVFPPEKDNPQGVTWSPLPAGSDPKRPFVVDLLGVLGGQQCVAYVRTWVHCDKDCAVLLELGSDDGVKIWLNNKQVYALNTARPLDPGSDKVNLNLHAGWNSLLLKITQNNLGWEFCARMRKPDGSHMDGLRVEAAPKTTSAATP